MSRKTSQEESGPPAIKAKKSVVSSFRFAWEGVMFVFSTQPHMRTHAIIILLVLGAAYFIGVAPGQFLHLAAATAIVLITEMFNTAIERTIDLTVTTYDPRAKIAKDMAAGAVLIAALYSLIVAGVVFGTNESLQAALSNIRTVPPRPHIGHVMLVIIGSVLLAILVAWIKFRTGRGTLLRGGIISGHTALGFLIATSIAIVTRDLAVATLAVALALLLSQSRVQARIHSPLEVLAGAALGVLVAWLIFLWPT